MPNIIVSLMTTLVVAIIVTSLAICVLTLTTDMPIEYGPVVGGIVGITTGLIGFYIHRKLRLS